MAVRRPVSVDATTSELIRFAGADTTPSMEDMIQISELNQVRSAITRYYVLNNDWPGQGGTEASLKSDLASILPYIGFPISRVFPFNATVQIESSGDPIAGEAMYSGMKAWRYSPITGQFICNLAAITTLFPSNNYDEL